MEIKGSAGSASLEIHPTLAEARELARKYNLIPVYHSFISDLETPVSAFLKLGAMKNSFLLESAEQGERIGRYSFLGCDPRAVITFSEGELIIREGDDLTVSPCDDPFGSVSRYLSRYRAPHIDELPPFIGGAVGMFGYDLVRWVEELPPPNPDDLGVPEMAFLVSDSIVIFDHLKHTTMLLANAFVEEGKDIGQSYEEARERVLLLKELLDEPLPHAEVHDRAPLGEPVSNFRREDFEAAVERVKEYIFAGDSFQTVPSQRFSLDVEVSPFGIYRGLRVVNPSPYMYYIAFDDFSLVGSSPEPLIKVNRGWVETRPIAGTRPRGATPEEDKRLAEDLLSDGKELAEHIMLVDLGRNDLGRVCEPGTVEVVDLMRIEYYSHVMHIVSVVVGRLKDGLEAADALKAAFPAGTVSGAPKIRSMEIIDELEPTKRGPYAGAIGYLSFQRGELDTCICIRTILLKDGRAYVQAGGGVVADSVPANEYEETRNKARAMFSAIRLAQEQREWE
ncbi:MAG: anthranilate synthase component I [Thermoleophilia bacterium]|nr:anthranilate synthase component I [Thermoleophilia bacterium]